MGVIKRRGATAKLSPICLGRNFITFHTRYGNEYFSVHADLLCNNSKYFKRRLQKNRRIIDGDCTICLEKLDPGTSDLAFCESNCGQNFHKHCIDEWKRSTIRETTCPLCRKSWKTRSKNISLPWDLKDLDLYAIHTYVSWLNRGKLHIDVQTVKCEGNSYHLQLLRTWRFSVRIEDDKFRNAVIAECINSIGKGNQDGFDLACIKYAYAHGSDCMRGFLVDAWLADKDVEHIKQHSAELPTRFVRKLGLAALTRLEKHVKCKDLLDKYTEGEYEYLTDNEY